VSLNDLPPRYGGPPVAVEQFDLTEWTEFMHYLYLPVRMPEWDEGNRLPERLTMFRPLVDAAAYDAFALTGEDRYIYVTARRGFATTDNPLNRPGWHCDGFGTDDLNYVWWDRWGTRFAEQTFREVSDDHNESLRQFEQRVNPSKVRTYPDRWLYRLTPYVVHTTPLLQPDEGGMRSFLKISVSRHQYNLEGNSHNYLFPYSWRMWPRDIARNDPAHAQTDFYEATA
jgi:hypothetical protein